VARNTAITAASRRWSNERPAQAHSSRSSSSPVKTGTGLSGTCGGFIPAIGSGILLVSQPLEELPQRPELVAGVRGAIPAQQPGDPPLHVPLADLLPAGAAGLREQAGGG
jgi:hypothetical protein